MDIENVDRWKRAKLAYCSNRKHTHFCGITVGHAPKILADISSALKSPRNPKNRASARVRSPGKSVI